MSQFRARALILAWLACLALDCARIAPRQTSLSPSSQSGSQNPGEGGGSNPAAWSPTLVPTLYATLASDAHHGTLPATNDRIHVYADQLSGGLSTKMQGFVANRFDGTQKMLAEDNSPFKALNPNWMLLHYRLACSSGPVLYIHNDTWSSDWTQVTANEAWFMHNQDNQRHHDPVDDWDINDVTNTDFQSYWINSVIADMRATGAQGVFADSFDAGVSGFGVTDPDVRFDGTNPGNPAVWANGITWFDQKKSWIDDIEAAFAATNEHFLYIPNIGALITSWADMDYSTIDGAMMEGFGNSSTVTSDWVLGMNRALALVAVNKVIIMQSYPAGNPGDPTNLQSRGFLLGTYLLLKGSYTYVNLAGSGVNYFPEYQLNFGPPQSTQTPTDVSTYAWSGVYRRDYQHGTAIVNPSGSPVSVSLETPMQLATASGGGPTDDTQIDASGNYTGGFLTFQNVSSLTIPAWGGALLVY